MGLVVKRWFNCTQLILRDLCLPCAPFCLLIDHYCRLAGGTFSCLGVLGFVLFCFVLFFWGLNEPSYLRTTALLRYYCGAGLLTCFGSAVSTAVESRNMEKTAGSFFSSFFSSFFQPSVATARKDETPCCFEGCCGLAGSINITGVTAYRVHNEVS